MPSTVHTNWACIHRFQPPSARVLPPLGNRSGVIMQPKRLRKKNATRCWSWPNHTGRATSEPQTITELTHKIIYIATDAQQQSGELNSEWTHLWYCLNRSGGTAKFFPIPQMTVWCRTPNSPRNGRGMLLTRRNGRGVGDAITVLRLYWLCLYTTWERSKSSLRSGKA